MARYNRHFSNTFPVVRCLRGFCAYSICAAVWLIFVWFSFCDRRRHSRKLAAGFVHPLSPQRLPRFRSGFRASGQSPVRNEQMVDERRFFRQHAIKSISKRQVRCRSNLGSRTPSPTQREPRPANHLTDEQSFGCGGGGPGGIQLSPP